MKEGEMKKYIPVIIVVAVLLLVLIVVLSTHKNGAVVKPGKAGKAVSATEVKKQQQITGLMQEAQNAYDAKNYQVAIQKTEAILKNVDNTSQAAKNLLQISQIHMNEQTPVAAPAAPQASTTTE
jgi:outer membrane protein assembly factor BamD (BamD/ComL family)